MEEGECVWVFARRVEGLKRSVEVAGLCIASSAKGLRCWNVSIFIGDCGFGRVIACAFTALH
jgi:hypothetical protein